MKTLLFFVFLLFCLLGCEGQNRFNVPQRMQKTEYEILYYVPSQVKLPVLQYKWNEILWSQRNGLMKSESLQLEGNEWLREGKSQLFDFYFLRKNYLRAQEIFVYADSVPAFLSKLTQKTFSKREFVFLLDSSPHKKTRTQIPSLAKKTIVIEVGTNHEPAWNEKGLLKQFVFKVSQRCLDPGIDHKNVWLQSILPWYIGFRATAVMATSTHSFLKTSRPLFSKRIHDKGNLDWNDFSLLVKKYQNIQLHEQIRQSALRLLISFPAFVEDAYGPRFFALCLREQMKHPKQDFVEIVAKNLLSTREKIGKLWDLYYNANYR